MRRPPTILSILAVAAVLSGLSGCASSRMFGLLPRSVTALVQDDPSPSERSSALRMAAEGDIEEAEIVRVSHVEPSHDGSIHPAAMVYPAEACGPAVAEVPGFQGQAYACAPYPTAYFNPYLIDPNEYLCDGGDHPPAARARAGDQIIGVDLEDTVVRYTTEAGDVHVQPSNRVCVYAPRFAAVRKVTGAESGELAVGAIGIERPQGPVRAQLNQPGLAVTGRDQLGRGAAVRGPDAMRDRNRGVPVERVQQLELAEDVLQVLANLSLVNRGELRDNEKPWLSLAAQSAVVWSVDMEVGVTVNSLAPVTLTRDQSAEALVVYDFPDAGRLRICKLADKSDALPGDIVTFILRVDNVGDSSVGNIVITDNLVTRLEYVADSQTSTAEAEFKTEANEGQSLRLTWKLDQPLKVGEGATIEFKCRVR
ncbi:MAG: DUF11 domain-containing protein [Planctomycetaceae bacterium]